MGGMNGLAWSPFIFVSFELFISKGVKLALGNKVQDHALFLRPQSGQLTMPQAFHKAFLPEASPLLRASTPFCRFLDS